MRFVDSRIYGTFRAPDSDFVCGEFQRLVRFVALQNTLDRLRQTLSHPCSKPNGSLSTGSSQATAEARRGEVAAAQVGDHPVHDHVQHATRGFPYSSVLNEALSATREDFFRERARNDAFGPTKALLRENTLSSLGSFFEISPSETVDKISREPRCPSLSPKRKRRKIACFTRSIVGVSCARSTWSRAASKARPGVCAFEGETPLLETAPPPQFSRDTHFQALPRRRS